jgi:dihydrodipicolinate synthase/N-acetylneuraminate lyase
MQLGRGPMIELPKTNGAIVSYALVGRPISAPAAPTFNRDSFAAAHVVRAPFSELEGEIAWDATLEFRSHLLSCGHNIAEAMDTAQRGMGLTSEQALQLVERTVAHCGAEASGRVFAGAGTDDIGADLPVTLDAVRAAYLRQIERIQSAGAGVILMASRALARAASSADDYVALYSDVLAQVDQPVILHWLGDMFDPQLAGYWGASAYEEAAEAVLAIIGANASKVRGIKVSLLDAQKEIDLRSRLPQGVRLYTGDDFNYPELIEGRDGFTSDALLGIFDPIAPIASAALTALAAGDVDRYHELFDPTLPLARHIFSAPTWRYKTGIVFLAWLNGHQSHFRMIDGAESQRSVLHLAELFRLADACGALQHPDLAVHRMRQFLEVSGVEQPRSVQLQMAG